MKLDLTKARIRLASLSANVEVSCAHWINAKNANTDQGISYCGACCEKHVTELNKKNPKGEYFMDGGWSQDSDTFENCDTCGVTLDTDFTEYAVREEIEYWRRKPIRMHLLSARGPYVAFRLLQTLDGIQTMDETPATKKFVRRVYSNCAK